MSRNGHARQRTLARSWLEERDLEVRDSGYDGLGRCEAQALAAPERAVDPYTAWLEHREDERERERPPIRWVYRPTAARPAGGDTRLVGTA